MSRGRIRIPPKPSHVSPPPCKPTEPSCRTVGRKSAKEKLKEQEAMLNMEFHKVLNLVEKIDTVIEDTHIYKSSDTKVAMIKALLKEYEEEE